VEIHSLLNSDLGTPLPLHISLSRPFVLATAEKDDFVNQLHRSFEQSEIAAFSVHPAALRWYHSPDSARSFLVLQVCGASGKSKDGDRNPDLAELLSRCNAIVRSFGQSELYAAPSLAATNEGNEGGSVGSAFHVSIAWAALDQWRQHRASNQPQPLSVVSGGSQIAGYEIMVDCIKVKIGNVINNIPLQRHRKAS
jgi:U6 snRNA phosphodiesterase